MYKLIKIIISLIFAVMIMSSCEKTKDKPQEPKKYYIEGKITFNDPESAPKQHKLMLELFINENDKFPEIEFELNTHDITNSVDIKQEIDEKQFGNYIAKLSIVETAVRKIELINYGKVQLQDNFTLPSKTITIASLTRLKATVFGKCTMCHGKNPLKIAAKLNLMPDSCYKNLVNSPSKNSTLLRVKPFEPQNSFIIKVLKKDIDFEHSASTNIWSIQTNLVENWILQGAKDD